MISAPTGKMKGSVQMKRISAIIAFSCVLLVAAAAHAEESVISPDGNIRAALSDDNGVITYSVYSGNSEIMRAEGLGITLTDTDFTSGAAIVSRADNVIDEQYEMVTGKSKIYTNKANESVFTIEKDGARLLLYVRVYDDGAAYRYALDRDAEAVSENNFLRFFGKQKGGAA